MLHFIYLGTICKDTLKMWQLCTTKNELYINESIDQQQNENNIAQVNSFLQCKCMSFR